MISSFLQFIEFVLAERIISFSCQIHILALVLLLAFWLWPIGIIFWRRWRKNKASCWVTMWSCRHCSCANPQDVSYCQKCGGPFSTPFWDTWISAGTVEAIHKGIKGTKKILRILGWTACYIITFVIFIRFRLYSFQQLPLQELFASMVVLFTLLFIFFYKKAFSSQNFSILSRSTDFAAGTAVLGFMALCAFLWAAAPYPQNKSLAEIFITPQGQIVLTTRHDQPLKFQGKVHRRNIQFKVQYVLASWPLFYMKQTFLVQTGDLKIMEPWVYKWFKKAAPRLQEDDPHRLRLVFLEQTLQAAPGRVYEITDASRGTGLVLKKLDKG